MQNEPPGVATLEIAIVEKSDKISYRPFYDLQSTGATLESYCKKFFSIGKIVRCWKNLKKYGHLKANSIWKTNITLFFSQKIHKSIYSMLKGPLPSFSVPSTNALLCTPLCRGSPWPHSGEHFPLSPLYTFLSLKWESVCVCMFVVREIEKRRRIVQMVDSMCSPCCIRWRWRHKDLGDKLNRVLGEEAISSSWSVFCQLLS